MMCKERILLLASIAIFVAACSKGPPQPGPKSGQVGNGDGRESSQVVNHNGPESSLVANDNDPESGQVVNGVYLNEYFGLKLPIPEDWFVANKDSEQHIMEVGEVAVAGDDAALKAELEVSKKTTFQLLTLSEFEMGAAVEFNPSLMLMAERVTHLPGIRSGSDYLFHLMNTLLRSQLPYEVTKSTYPTQLGDRQWDRAECLLNRPQMPVSQAYISTKHHDFVLIMILSAKTSEQMAALEQVASSIVLEEVP